VFCGNTCTRAWCATFRIAKRASRYTPGMFSSLSRPWLFVVAGVPSFIADESRCKDPRHVQSQPCLASVMHATCMSPAKISVRHHNIPTHRLACTPQTAMQCLDTEQTLTRHNAMKNSGTLHPCVKRVQSHPATKSSTPTTRASTSHVAITSHSQTLPPRQTNTHAVPSKTLTLNSLSLSLSFS
jgi:hypothetical protein